jgi:hypothetical protein
MEASTTVKIDLAEYLMFCFRWLVHLVCWDFVIALDHGFWIFVRFISCRLSEMQVFSFLTTTRVLDYRFFYFLFLVRHIVGIQGGCFLDLWLVTWMSDIFLGNKGGGSGGWITKITILQLLTGMERTPYFIMESIGFVLLGTRSLS